MTTTSIWPRSMSQAVRVLIAACTLGFLTSCQSTNPPQHALPTTSPAVAAQSAPDDIHVDVLALRADRKYDHSDQGRHKAWQNWFRSFDAESGMWFQSDGAGGPHEYSDDGREAVEAYIQKRGWDNLHFSMSFHHAYLHVLVYKWGPPPPGMGRVGSDGFTFWYDAYVHRLVAYNAGE